MKRIHKYIIIFLSFNCVFGFNASAQLYNDTTLKLSKEKRYNVNATSKTTGIDLESYPDMLLSNTLQGKLNGLSVFMSTGGLANNAAVLYIRGLHREVGNGIITIVDGVERDINMINPEEIETIEVMKDISAKIFYGPRAANGVLVITTKRGVKNNRVIKVNAEYGMGLPEKLPSYLNSYDYVRLYNQARTNDGLEPLYSTTALDGYKNSTGVNDLRYPNVDYYDYFLRKNTEYRKVNVEFSGGNDAARYAFIAGYNGNSGLQSVGETPQRDRFSVRGNLDMKVNDIIYAFIGIGGTFDVTKRSALDHAQTFAALSSHRPNEYPFIISEQYIKPDSVGFPNMGTGIYTVENLYGSLLYGGYQKDQNVNGQLNFGLSFDFNSLLKGLTGKAQLTFDNYFYGSEGLSSNPALYSQRWIQTPDGRDSVIFTMRKKSQRDDELSLRGDNTYRTTGIQGELNYAKKLNENNYLKADYTYNYYLAEVTGINQDTKYINNVLRVNWVKSQKYLAEANLGYMGSNKFQGANQFSTSFTGGLGWIISEENFLKQVEVINYLKLKATAGVLTYDGQTAYNLYRDRWNDNGTVRINNSLEPLRVNFAQMGNPDLKWEKSREINFGFEAMLLKNKLWIEANYFNELRYDIISNVSSMYPGTYGGFFPQQNFGKVANNGFELEVKYADKVGELNYQLGANMVFSKNKVLVTSESNGIYTNLNRTGKPSDAIFGYVAAGLFGKEVDMNSHPTQYLGAYQAGDIAYVDLYSDAIINENDRQMIGNSFPRTQLSLDVNLQYRGFGLYILGTSQLGFTNLLNNSYYWMRAEDKYSVLALGSYHPSENPTGTYPRLTTTDGANNFRNSTFWLQAADFLRLKNIELSYTFKPVNIDFMKKVKVYTRGTNLFQLSANDDLDVEALNAGITNYPLLMNLTAGVSVSF